jgi:outer membrane receptor for ferric coprogen and ferric-rhodotorulic acid
MKWFIPGNVPSSKNSRRWTGKFFIASKTTMKYRTETQKLFATLADSFKQEYSKYQLPVYVHFKFIRGSHHKFDYINPAQTVQDDMVKHGWIEDDNCDFIIPCFEQYTYDKNNPGVIIEIKDDKNTKINKT